MVWYLSLIYFIWHNAIKVRDPQVLIKADYVLGSPQMHILQLPLLFTHVQPLDMKAAQLRLWGAGCP